MRPAARIDPPRRSAPAPSANRNLSTSIAARTVTTKPGFVVQGAQRVLDTAVFTPVATLTLPPWPSPGQVVLSTEIHVQVTTRTALSVVASCVPRPGRRGTPAPPLVDPDASSDSLVIGQNPLPGTSATAVASRTLRGRAVIDLAAGRAYTCTLKVSPRTETLDGSLLALLGGALASRRADVPARAGQRRALLVGDGAAAGEPATVAVVPALTNSGQDRLRAEGEMEVTTCALGYHLCGHGGKGTSMVEAWLRASGPAGRCPAADGVRTRFTLGWQEHHTKVVLPPLDVPPTCPSPVSAAIVLRVLRGDAVEVEPSFAEGRVQTHTWLERSG